MRMAIGSQGTTLTIDTTDIAGLESYGGFDGESTEIDTTNLASVAKEFMIGLEDFGNFTVNLHSDNGDAGQAAMQAAKTARSSNVYVLTLSDAQTATFTAYVKSFTYDGSVDDVDRSVSTLRISGAVVWA